jgi:hypothetical protein
MAADLRPPTPHPTWWALLDAVDAAGWLAVCRQALADAAKGDRDAAAWCSRHLPINDVEGSVGRLADVCFGRCDRRRLAELRCVHRWG